MNLAKLIINKVTMAKLTNEYVFYGCKNKFWLNKHE
jgi:hypothetical protein